MTSEVRELGGVDEQLAQLERWVMLAEHVPTRDWLEGVRSEIEALKSVPFRIGDKSVEGVLGAILESCGLGFPRDAREQFDCFLAVKTVVHWAERKLKEIEDNARWYYELLREKRKIEEEGAND